MDLLLVEFALRDPRGYIFPVSSPAMKGFPLAVTSMSLLYDSALINDEAVVVGTGKRRFAETSSEENVFPVGKKDGTSVAMTRSIGTLHECPSAGKTIGSLTIENCIL